jgi:hypothetical protein
MHIQLRLSFVFAIAMSYFASGVQAQAPTHNGAAIMHDPEYNNCIDPSGDYHNSHPGDLQEM